MAAKKFIAFGDSHIPYHNPASMDIIHKVIEKEKPDIVVCLGDLLDCNQFGTHPATWGMMESKYLDDTAYANKFLDRIQKYCDRLILIEGNHEFRIDKWAANSREGRGVYNMVAPRLQLMRDRKNCKYVPYGSANSLYPHHKINNRIVAVHGWSYAINATKKHLTMSQGRSILHGHTHRADTSMIQDIFVSGRIIQARSAGCTCKLIPMYGTGSPVQWVNSFVIGYLGRTNDTQYTIPITNGNCVLPDGKEIIV